MNGLIITAGIPILVAVGYLHFKKSSAYKAEADISFESHPHLKRMLQNTENMLPLYLKMSEMMIKISKNEKLSDKEIEEITLLQNELSKHIEKRLSGKYESNVYDTNDKQ